MVKYKHAIVLLFFLGNLGLGLVSYATDQSDKEMAESIQKSRLAAIDFLDPIINSVGLPEQPNELKKIQNTIYDVLSTMDVHNNILRTKPHASSNNVNCTFLVQAIQKYLYPRQLEDLEKEFQQLLSTSPNKTAKTFLFLIELRDEIKKAHFSRIYRKAEICTSCKNPWTQCSKSLGHTIRECLFCGHDELLCFYKEPKAPLNTPKISGRKVQWLHDSAGDIYLKVLLNSEAAQENEGKGEPVMLSDVKNIDNKPSRRKTSHLVLLEKGSHIEFHIRVNKPGECGFGFSIATDHANIIDKSYEWDIAGKNTFLTHRTRRYKDQNTEQFIKFDTIANCIYCTVSCWEIKSFEKDGLKYPRAQRQNAWDDAGIRDDDTLEEGLPNSKLRMIENIEDGEDIGSLRIAFYLFANKKEREAFYSAYSDIQCDDF